MSELIISKAADLQRFYENCVANGTVLVLFSQFKNVPESIGFQLPSDSATFRLSREEGLIAEPELWSSQEGSPC